VDLEIIKTVLGAGGMTGLIILGIWQLLKRAVDGFTHAMDTVTQLHKERADALEKKLDACERRHEEVNSLIGQLREDNGILKGKVQALELLAGRKDL
jgi:hypothetical protein